MILGYLLITNEKVAEWGLSHGKAKIWVRLLGMERAKKLTKYFFGPLVVLMGLAALAISILALVTGRV
jgi:hypothetical protein